jgi:hypothetical protein
MPSFLKSILRKTDPNILEGLAPLRDVDDVTDFCLFDSEARILGVVSKYGNDESLFSYIGKEVGRTALLLDKFGAHTGSVVKYCQIQCKSGMILTWNFGGSFLLVLLRDTRQIPVVRMTVNIFKETASREKNFEKFFREPPEGLSEVWATIPATTP